MKSKLILLLFTICIFIAKETSAQSWRMSIGYGTSSAIHADFFKKDMNSFHIGGSYQFADTRGKLVQERKANYGREIDGTGQYFWGVDLGYGRFLTEKISINGEVSVGSQNDFTNYLDGHFNGGGYHLVNSSEIVAGIGANVGFVASEYFSFFGGYNTLRNATFGIRLSLPTDNF
ncbi:MAG: hypothetical protein R3220_00425 [Balneolaceae bacterium]|nr:hypothetical protein [Balneolaceae bacterium]